MAQRDVEIDFTSSAYKVEQNRFVKSFTLMPHWEMFYHYLPTMLIGSMGAAVWAPISIEKGGSWRLCSARHVTSCDSQEEAGTAEEGDMIISFTGGIMGRREC